MASNELERLVRDYLAHLTVERGLSEHTVSGYRRDLTRYAEFLAGRGVTQPGAVTPAEVTAHLAWLSSADGDRPALAPASVARAVVAVRSLHRFALEEGITAENPAAQVQPPRPGVRLPKALSLAQVEALLAAPDTDTVTGLRDRALLELLYGTGARISEVTALDVDDVSRLLGPDADPDQGLRLIGKGNKERLVPVGGFAREALDAWLVRGRPQLAARSKKSTPALLLNARGTRFSRQSAWAALQAAAETAKLEVEISPHTLRHSYATHLLDGGADVRVVQELLGHASVTTTQIYTLVTVDHLRETYLTAHPRAY
ncbi:site-specific tyrosine recombinase XerD [Enemella dayhoffiae]|uniref:Tyrosine recombinase XerC n=1 Tax=Enemella dayhoffiae TaxID=2016507 RepID=A0A255H635_9ACTN|nr:site-specific tyrosine recombinase XerD [Enemella dayhoffiae]OYO22104.1 site-specific tyrosine recombinase XerD [Enemella dayhoffiae]